MEVSGRIRLAVGILLRKWRAFEMVKRVKVVVVVDKDNADSIVVACCNAPSIKETLIDTANLLFVCVYLFLYTSF